MNVLTQTRQEVADALQAGGIDSLTYVPANLYPPLALVSSAPEYVTLPVDNTFATPYTVTLQVLLLVGTNLDEATLEAADDLIVNAVDALDDWDVTEVTAPFEFKTTDGTEYAAVMLTVQTNTSIERQV